MTTTLSRLKWICGVALLLAASTRSSPAWLRFYEPDDELAQKADAIVVGHIDGGFTAFEAPSKYPSAIHWWEYRTTLIVTQSLSGKIQVGPQPIILHYGIRPVVLKDKPAVEALFNPPAADQNATAATPVGIKDVCSWGGELSDNIRQDHIWFLSSSQHGGPGPGNEDLSEPGVWSPQDVQKLERKPYYLAVLSGDPAALDPFLAQRSDWQIQCAKKCQARLRVKQIDQVSDANNRCDQLLAVYLKEGPLSSTGELAMDGIMACGTIGATKLVPVFEDTANHTLDRRSILNAWKGVTWQGLPRSPRFAGADAAITKWLQTEDQWWSTQTAKDRIFAAHEGQKGGAPYNDPRAVSFRNLYCAVEALGDLSATDTKPLIRKIRNRWADAAPFDSNNDFLKLCDDVFSSR